MDFHIYTQACSLCFLLHSAYKLGGDCYVAYHSIGSFAFAGRSRVILKCRGNGNRVNMKGELTGY